MARIRNAATKDVQAFLHIVAAQAAAQGGILEFTEDLAKAMDTAVWKLEQQATAEAYHAYVYDKQYRYY
jgi:hypothetical protein